jgi:hypothetical protein
VKEIYKVSERGESKEIEGFNNEKKNVLELLRLYTLNHLLCDHLLHLKNIMKALKKGEQLKTKFLKHYAK